MLKNQKFIRSVDNKPKVITYTLNLTDDLGDGIVIKYKKDLDIFTDGGYTAFEMDFRGIDPDDFIVHYPLDKSLNYKHSSQEFIYPNKGENSLAEFAQDLCKIYAFMYYQTMNF